MAMKTIPKYAPDSELLLRREFYYRAFSDPPNNHFKLDVWVVDPPAPSPCPTAFVSIHEPSFSVPQLPGPPFPCDDTAMAPVERKFFLHPTLSSHARSPPRTRPGVS